MTKTTLTRDEVNAAYNELVAAANVFKEAVLKFKDVYDAESVSISGISDDVFDVVWEIKLDIEETFEEDEDEDED
jgi:hypothetical protein